jgi:hypothetical protein
MTLLEALREVIWRNTRQWREPEHLQNDLANLLRGEFTAKLGSLTDQGIACFK